MLEKFKKKPKLGRPPLAPEDKKRYSRVALYPETREKIKKLSESFDSNMVDFVDIVITIVENDDEIRNKINERLSNN